MTKEELVKEWLGNFQSNRTLLIRLVGRIVRADEIEDIVQETFLLTYAAAQKHKIVNPRAFIMRSGRNIALNHVTRAERKLNCSIEDIDNIDEVGQVATVSVEARFQSQERYLIFCRAVAKLPVAVRRVFILQKIYGLSHAEIADQLDLSTSTVEKHISTGMSKTSSYMAKHGYPAGDNDQDGGQEE